MHIDWDQIDWSATALAAVAYPLGLILLVVLALPDAAQVRVLHWAAKRSPTRHVSVALGLSILMVSVVAVHDPNGWFGQSTAAWVQAFGSVGAILVAVWVDRAASERLRKDREAEWAKQRQDREAAVRDMNGARVVAVRNLRDLCRSADHHLKGWDGQGDYVLPGDTQRAITAARTVIVHRLQRPGEIDGSVIALLALADQEGVALHGPNLFGVMRTNRDRDERRRLFTAVAEKLDGLLEDYNNGVL
ncbi:MAG: hypothetical protein JHD15_19425 [Phenylobacterium sp.]|uniref:hypothetical protein n=1 Tax=Phenylobacterium sp. TaxID=1871053 RepID=UPI001A1AF2D6|nr:hypothetical protein [Phenylobacterium sp.]MBJ7412510.1 hypothetical protein [Phenylobacterium sp.]